MEKCVDLLNIRSKTIYKLQKTTIQKYKNIKLQYKNIHIHK